MEMAGGGGSRSLRSAVVKVCQFTIRVFAQPHPLRGCSGDASLRRDLFGSKLCDVIARAAILSLHQLSEMGNCAHRLPTLEGLLKLGDARLRPYRGRAGRGGCGGDGDWVRAPRGPAVI